MAKVIGNGILGNLIHLLLAVVLLTKASHALTSGSEYGPITGISVSLPFPTVVQVYDVALESTPVNNTQTSISGPANVVLNTTVNVVDGILIATFAGAYDQGSGGGLQITVPPGFLSNISAPASQNQSNGNITVAGAALNESLFTNVLSQGGGFLQITNGTSLGLVAALEAYQADTVIPTLLDANGTFGSSYLAAGPNTTTFLTGNFTKVAVRMQQGSFLNISASGPPALPNITGIYMAASVLQQQQRPTAILYNQGTCMVLGTACVHSLSDTGPGTITEITNPFTSYGSGTITEITDPVTAPTSG